MNWLYYLGEANLYLCVFYLCYCLFLNKETHYTLNRVYLLFSCVVSFLLPLLQVGILKPVETGAQNAVAVTTLPGDVVYSAVPVQTVPVAEVIPFTLQDGILYAYLFGAAILLILLAVKLYKLAKLARSKYTVSEHGYKLVYMDDSSSAFSFFNYLFIGTKAPGPETIIRHELVHIRQKHSVDIILLELFKIINWFNPLVYLLQNSLKTVHEYIADEQTAANGTDAITYSSFLVDNAYGISGLSITHSFFNYNLLKKRIIMLNQQRSGSLARLKYLMAVPLCAALLCISTLSFSKTYGWVDLAPRHKIITPKPIPHSPQPVPQAGKVTPPKPKVDVVMFPPPIIVKNSYLKLFIHVHNTIHYTLNQLKTDQLAVVIVNFTITADHQLSGVKIVKSGGDVFDKAILKSFGSYNGALSDTPGEHSFIIKFVSDGKSEKVDPAAYNAPGYAGEIVITGRYAPPVVRREAKHKVDVVKFPPPVVLRNTGNDTVKHGFEKFYNYLGRSIKYPAIDRENNVTGKVFVSFTVDANGKVEDVKVLRGPTKSLDDEVLRVVKNCNSVQGAKPGRTYTVPVLFTLNSDNETHTANSDPAPAMQAVNSDYKLTSKNLELDEVVIVGYSIK